MHETSIFFDYSLKYESYCVFNGITFLLLGIPYL